MDYVIDRLYIGDHEAACLSTKLTDSGITHILTVDMKPLPLEKQEGFRYKFCHALDTERTDLLTELEACLHFIAEGRSAGGVLVHCFAGQSRSAAVVLAYLMRVLDLSLNDATDLLTRQRPQIRPNAGFVEQLSLFEQMGKKVDGNNELFRRYELQRLTDCILNRAPIDERLAKDCMRSDPSLTSQPDEVLYKCRKCRRPLFKHCNVLTHEEGRGEAAFDWRTGLPSGGGDKKRCTQSLFVEPVGWMQTAIADKEGKLACPKCSAKLGSFKWSGSQCSCGAWVTPAFHIQNGKVDKCKPLAQASSPHPAQNLVLPSTSAEP